MTGSLIISCKYMKYYAFLNEIYSVYKLGRKTKIQSRELEKKC